ncbi:response regulator transcription factor [bacterium]|nr:response regulator transcription factor [bacterium]
MSTGKYTKSCQSADSRRAASNGGATPDATVVGNGPGTSPGVAVRIAIADDHALFRQGVRSLLRQEQDVDIVAEAERVDDIAPLLARHRCDLLLLDLQMDRSALPAIPALARAASVIVLTMNENVGDAAAAIRNGALAVVFKRFAVTTLLEAIRAVAAGQAWLPPTVQRVAVAELGAPSRPAISEREREIIRHVALGRRNAEVARDLFISEETVKKHLNSIFQKLAVRDRVQLTLFAIRTGIVTGFESH